MKTIKKNFSLLWFAQQRADMKKTIGKYATAELYEVTTHHFKQFLNGQSCRPATSPLQESTISPVTYYGKKSRRHAKVARVTT